MGMFSTITREHSEFNSPKDGETVSRPGKNAQKKEREKENARGSSAPQRLRTLPGGVSFGGVGKIN